MSKAKPYKLKTKSGLKKRFKFSSSGKIIGTQSGKRHNMRKRSQRSIRNQRGTAVMNSHCVKVIKHHIGNNS